MVRGASPTVKVPATEEAEKLPVAGKLAASEWGPAFKTPKLKTAEPLESVIEDAVPPSRLSVTLPPTVPPEELTETVTLSGLPYVVLVALRMIEVEKLAFTS
jgi:hypothetical protein